MQGTLRDASASRTEDLRQVTILIDENRIVVEDRFLLDGTYSRNGCVTVKLGVLIPGLTLKQRR